jgi:hypothetical protein
MGVTVRSAPASSGSVLSACPVPWRSKSVESRPEKIQRLASSGLTISAYGERCQTVVSFSIPVSRFPGMFVFGESQRYHPCMMTHPDGSSGPKDTLRCVDVWGLQTSLTGSITMPQLDQQDQRIATIFGTEDVPDVSTATLERYRDYLQQQLELPCQLTGIESFDWEEYYTFGPGSAKEYERLRKTRPSCMDTYELLSFEDDVDPDSGLLVNVRRVSDAKQFLLPLADLEATKKKTKNYQLLDDYAVWFVNWR